MVERVLFVLSRYREASIAAVAIVLVVYFQIGSDGEFLTSQLLSVVFRDTGPFRLDRGRRSHADDHRRDRSLGRQHVLAGALHDGAALDRLGRAAGDQRDRGTLLGVLIGVVNGVITVAFRVPSLITTVGTLFLLQGMVVSLYNSQPIISPVEEPFNEFSARTSISPRTPRVLAWPDGIHAVPVDRRGRRPLWRSS